MLFIGIRLLIWIGPICVESTLWMARQELYVCLIFCFTGHVFDSSAFNEGADGLITGNYQEKLVGKSELLG